MPCLPDVLHDMLPVGLTDAAAFQQVLSMLVVHLHSLYDHGMGFSITEALSYHDLAITSVKNRLLNSALRIPDGIIAAVIGFVCHAVGPSCRERSFQGFS